jgi:molybdopterin-guanine dinucleotide biosynthesis protein A
MLAWPLAALTGAQQRVAIVAKADSVLPPLPAGVARWDEPPQPRHPIVGIVEALRRAGGEAVLVCAVDLPLVDAGLIRALAEAEVGPGGVVIAAAPDAEGRRRVQPLLGRYEPEALAALQRAPADAPLTATVLGLDPAIVDVAADSLLNVNEERDRAHAERCLLRSSPVHAADRDGEGGRLHDAPGG